MKDDMRLDKVVRSFGGALLIAAGLACSGEDATSSSPPEQVSDRLTVEISVHEDSLLLGTSKVFSASVVNQFNAPRRTVISWTSTNIGVLSVTTQGTVTAVGEGSAQIVAGITGSADTLDISVTHAPVASVSVTLGSSSIVNGLATQVTAIARDAGGNAISGLALSYSSSDTAVATVSATGQVWGVGTGNATISVAKDGTSDSAIVTVTPAAPAPAATVPAAAAAALARIGPTVSPTVATSLGSPYARYDALWVKWEPVRWSLDSSSWSGNYYDRAQTYYAQWIRTGNPAYKERGDAIAVDYRRNYLEVNNYQASAHWSQLDGLALHYWLNGDSASLIALGRTAKALGGSAVWLRSGPWTDARQQARALIALLLGWQTNAPNAPQGGWAASLDRGLDAILQQQSPDGAWRYPVNTCDLSLNYMGAMLADALIRVHTQYRADPRIAGAIRMTADFLWTQWRANDSLPSFNYYEAQCTNQHGNAGPSPTRDLTGIFTSTYAWMATQDPAYRARSDAVFDAAMTGIYPAGSKQFNQAFAFGWRALGYLH